MGYQSDDFRPSATELFANAASNGTLGNPILAAAFSHEAIGERLVRLKYAFEADQYKDALQMLNWTALGKNRKWKADHGQVKRLAGQVLKWWISDACPACMGRGSQQIEDTPHLEGKVCSACHGNKTRRLDVLHDPTWGPRAQELLDSLNESVRRFGARTAAALFRGE